MQHCFFFFFFSSLSRTKDLRPGETESSSNAGSVKVRLKHLNSALKANERSSPTSFPHWCLAKDSLRFLRDTQC